MSEGDPIELAWPAADYDDTALVEYLEPDQLAARAARPVPRAILRGRTRILLWGLRIFVIVVGAMVIYTFVSQTVRGTP